uniref:Putative secreted protein n=1 Tax=Anopheles darlingi TaxID=43151 RepID=A0A2M4D8P6_ANODA
MLHCLPLFIFTALTTQFLFQSVTCIVNCAFELHASFVALDSHRFRIAISMKSQQLEKGIFKNICVEKLVTFGRSAL